MNATYLALATTVEGYGDPDITIDSVDEGGALDSETGDLWAVVREGVHGGDVDERGEEQWHTLVAVENAAGDEIDTVAAPVSEEWDPRAVDRALRDAGWLPLGPWYVHGRDNTSVLGGVAERQVMPARDLTCRATLDADQVATLIGVLPRTWRAYVHRGQAPAPLPGRDPDTGRLRWATTDVQRWQASRHGPGRRRSIDPG